MKSESRIVNTLRRGAPALLLTLAYAGVAQAQDAPILSPPSCSPVPTNTVYKIEIGATPPTSAPNPHIRASSLSTWSFPIDVADTCTVVSTTARTCSNLAVTIPGSGVNANVTPDFTAGPGGAASGSQQVKVAATRSGMTCAANFTIRGVSGGGGWGDPHLTTVDGIKYDFQSAGEFTALRENGFEVQTRQSPVPTATVPITNAYTGITHCVAIYTAVAAKLGTSRVTVQPSPGAEPDPKSMQVRVNGKVVKLGDTPYPVRAGGNEKGALEGTITQLPDGMYEIRDVVGTQIVVTSAYWDARKVWYLNVNIYGTSAHQGTMGKLGERSWLPALPDGSSVGAKPASEADRYKVLYEKFADAWRVTDDTSLFDYEQGTNTATFTRDEWPRNHPESCAIEGQPSAQAATEEVAQQACANVVDATKRADCVFDVMVTGNAGFGKSYEVMQRFTPLPSGWYSPVPIEDPPPCKECKECKECPPPSPPWWCWPLIVLGLVLLVYLVLRARKKP